MFNQLLELLGRLITPQSKPIQLGIWGTTGSGKSTYLATLYRELLRSNRWRVAADPKARKFLERLIAALETGRFPPPNMEGGKLETYEYYVSSQETEPKLKQLNITLKFIDAPGNYYENLGRGVGKIASETGETDVLDYLCSCDGIIFLLDPERPKNLNKLSLLLLNLMQEFQQRAMENSMDKRVHPLEQYMAFCVTKSDRDARLWQRGELEELPETLVKELVGEFFFESLHHGFCRKDRFKFFPLSSVGRHQEGDRWVSGILEPGSNNSKTSIDDSTASPSSKQTFDPWSNLSFTPEPSVPASPPQQNDYGLGSASKDAEGDSLTQGRTIDTNKSLRPLNVLEPVEWLITNIYQNPPVLPPRKSIESTNP